MTISQEYFDWMYHLVCVGPKSYKKLFSLLHNIEFIFVVPLDQNRYEDGVSLRYRFGEYEGVIAPVVSSEIDNRPCSVLEMLIALSWRIEESIMSDNNYGNRTAEWFWTMMDNLRLGEMDDRNFDESYVCVALNKFMYRTYGPNGSGGGLFILQNPREDLRTIDIWQQAMWYLSELINRR